MALKRPCLRLKHHLTSEYNVSKSVDEELGHRHEAHPIPHGGRLGDFAACLGGISLTDEDRHTVLLAEPLREAEMVRIAVRQQERPDIHRGSSHRLELAKQILPMATGIDERDRASVLDEIAVDHAR
jgi:hypothetical protein